MLRKAPFSVVATILAVGLACSSDTSRSEAGVHEAGPPFEAVSPRAYVAKVKNVLVGLAPTEEELKAVEADKSRLGSLVDGWMKLPQFSQKMMRFFGLAFQQTQIASDNFTDQVFSQLDWNPRTTPLLLQNTKESFARTMVALTGQGRPFTEAVTTRQLMMTTALKELYAFLDTWEIDNEGNIFDSFRKAHRGVPIVVEAAAGPIPIAETLDRASPNYMHWYNPDLATVGTQIAECMADPVQLAPKAISIHYLLLGTLDGRRLRDGRFCQLTPGTPNAPQLTDADFNDWTMVTIQQAKPGEPTTTFYDLPLLRRAKDLVLSVPRIGFFSTPAFFANWQTNVSNQMRVTINQALIVATGSSVDGTDATHPTSTPGLDSSHASDGECLACHRTLDPTRSIFSATFSWNYHSQVDGEWTSQPGLFAFRDVIQPVQNLADFALVLAEHPLFAPGWVQKLCYYVSSAACDESDFEFRRLVTLFQRSGYSWHALVKAFMTSPITTHAAATRTGRENGEGVTVSRRDHFCAALDARLGFTDVCGLDGLGNEEPTTITAIVSGLPSDAYGRGSVSPILPREPSLFFAAGTENICAAIAERLVDVASGDEHRGPAAHKHWSSTEPDAAISDFVVELMGLTPLDPRSAAARAVLQSHFASALGQPGITPTDALRSTFIVACRAPTTVSLGL